MILLLELARSKHLSLPLILGMWLDLLGHMTKNCRRTSCFGHYSKLAAFGLFSKWAVVTHQNWCILFLKPRKKSPCIFMRFLSYSRACMHASKVSVVFATLCALGPISMPSINGTS